MIKCSRVSSEQLKTGRPSGADLNDVIQPFTSPALSHSRLRRLQWNDRLSFALAHLADPALSAQTKTCGRTLRFEMFLSASSKQTLRDFTTYALQRETARRITAGFTEVSIRKIEIGLMS